MTKRQQRKQIEYMIESYPGWRDIILACEACMDSMGARLSQIKEKFGGLRMYCDLPEGDGWPWQHELFYRIEGMSLYTCDRCGKPGSIKGWGTGWITCKCDTCGNKQITEIKKEEERRKKHQEEFKARQQSSGGTNVHTD